MEYINNTAAVISAFSVIFNLFIKITYNNFSLNKKYQIKLLEKLGDAISKNKVPVAYGIFSLLFGGKIHASFSDIKSLYNRENFNELSYCLQKLPGFCQYKNNKLIYSGVFKYKQIRLVFEYFSLASTMLMYSVVVYLLVNLITADILNKITILFTSIVALLIAYFAMIQYKQIKTLNKLVAAESLNRPN